MNICFTGHRPKDLFGYEKEKYYPLFNNIKKLVNKYSNDYSCFISGGAQGVDQLSFWAVDAAKKLDNIKVKNIVYIPFKDFSNNWNLNGLFSKSDFKNILENADEIKYINSSNDKIDNIIPFIFQRNEEMVKDSDLIFAIINFNKDINGKGGTSHTIRQALKYDKNILFINPFKEENILINSDYIKKYNNENDVCTVNLLKEILNN